MIKTKNILAGALLMISGSAFAGSALYEVDVYGLQGLSLFEGNTVWQPTPMYPKMALRKGVEGKVLVEYSINEQGKAENIKVLNASPKGFFDRTTINALENASFGTAYAEGRPVRVDGIKKHFVYEIVRDSAGVNNYQVSSN